VLCRKNIISITTATLVVIYKTMQTSYYYVGSIAIDNYDGHMRILIFYSIFKSGDLPSRP